MRGALEKLSAAPSENSSMSCHKCNRLLSGSRHPRLVRGDGIQREGNAQQRARVPRKIRGPHDAIADDLRFPGLSK